MESRTLQKAILELLATRAEGRTACPSEIARRVAGEQGHWRELMPDVRRAADELAAAGLIVVTQRGKKVIAQQATGPIRLARKSP